MGCVGGKIRWVVVGHIDGYAVFSGFVGLETPSHVLRMLSVLDCFPLDLISTFESFEMTDIDNILSVLPNLIGVLHAPHRHNFGTPPVLYAY